LENQDIDQVILNYLRGEATTNEIEFLRKWMIDHEGHEAVFESVKTYWEHSNLQVKSTDLDRAYSKLKYQTFRDAKAPTINHYKEGKRKFNWFKVAAVFVFFFTIVGMIYFLENPKELQAESKAVTEVIKENPKGQKLTTFLPDGSKIILNSQSKIRYKAPFESNERLVELEGEAFFEVKKDDEKPFRVVVGGVSATVLGTRFNVNGKTTNIVEVALVSGKVRVSKDPDHSVVLDPGKAAIVPHEGEFEILDFDQLEKTGWKDGVLVFKDNTLPEIVTILEDWYGVNVVAEGKLETNFHYSGKYHNETLEDVLAGISFVHHFEFKVTGDTVKIFSNHKM